MTPDDKVVLGYLDHGTVRGEFAHDLFILGASRPGRFAGLMRAQESLISRGRNYISKSFIGTSSDWLLMLDADQRISAEMFDSLCEVADADERPVVSGLYFSQTTSPLETAYPTVLPSIFSHSLTEDGAYDPIIHYPPNSVIRVNACGAGMLLVHRRVFEKIFWTSEPELADYCWFRDAPTETGRSWRGEDIYFCRQIEAAGFPIYCHTGVISPHIKNYVLTEDHFRASVPNLDKIGVIL